MTFQTNHNRYPFDNSGKNILTKHLDKAILYNSGFYIILINMITEEDCYDYT